MLKVRRELNECLKYLTDLERETRSPEIVAVGIKQLKLNILNLLAVIDAEAETVVRFPQASRAHQSARNARCCNLDTH